VKKGILKSVFNGVIGAAGYLAEKPLVKIFEANDDIEFPSQPGVPLTKGEAALLKSIFGEQEIQTGDVRKYFADKKHPYAIAAAMSAKKIKFYGKETHAADYSQTNDVTRYWTFVHEMTHVWQYQHPLRDFNRSVHNPTRQYDYKLSPDMQFKNFGVEQQASIIADYAQQFLYQGPKPANDNMYGPLNENPYLWPQSLDMLKKTVEDRFPAARNTRLALEAQNKKPPNPGSRQSFRL
jgi:hypothetical protein